MACQDWPGGWPEEDFVIFFYVDGLLVHVTSMAATDPPQEDVVDFLVPAGSRVECEVKSAFVEISDLGIQVWYQCGETSPEICFNEPAPESYPT